MPEVRKLKEPVKSQLVEGKPIPTPDVPREPRAPKVKKFPNGAIQVLGHDYSVLTIKAPSDMTFENALIPEAWVHASRKVAMDTNRRREWIGSIIHLHSANGEWFAELYIRKVVYDKFKQPCGLAVTCIGPVSDPKTGEAMPVNVATGLPWVDPVEEAEAA